MNLKEAFRYQNKLQSLLDEAQGILDCDANVTKVANTYLRHKVMPEAEDETVMDVAQTEYAEQITDVARFMLYLLEEKSRQGAVRRAGQSLLFRPVPLAEGKRHSDHRRFPGGRSGAYSV